MCRRGRESQEGGRGFCSLQWERSGWPLDAMRVCTRGYILTLDAACVWVGAQTCALPASQGLFDNFLRLRLRDSSLGTVCAALDWLAFDDLLGCAAHHSQSFQLLRYPPFLPVAFHLLLACSHVPRIVFPSSQQEVCPSWGLGERLLGREDRARPARSLP